MKRIGIDIGRVIIGPTVYGEEGTQFLGRTVEEALGTPPVPGAFPTIKRLVSRAEERVWLVSKCGPSVEQKTRRWLDHWRFFEATDLPPEHVRFCRERPEKAKHARELGLDLFIDDRLEVIEALRPIVPRLLLFGEGQPETPDWVVLVRDWREVAAWFDTRLAARSL